ncbi:TetR family transcriptional regulator [Glycomyces sp. NPDC046736]|uniref:TetR/AcrR family transcriptional regulator n=1 Tax=Glycomyces sp. NPDC046736 TaxID=3155615 RepID=UPI0033E68917
MSPATAPQNSRGRRTRSALLAAIAEIVENEGFAGLTMNAVADRAGVSRRAVYLHFASRAELIPALHDYVIEEQGLEESLERVWARDDPVEALEEWAAHLARVHLQVLAVDRAVRYTRHADPDVEAYRRNVSGRQLESCRAIVEGLSEAGLLDPHWTVDRAVEMLWALISTDLFEALHQEAEWDAEAVREHFAFLLRRTFVSAARQSADPQAEAQ